MSFVEVDPNKAIVVTLNGRDIRNVLPKFELFGEIDHFEFLSESDSLLISFEENISFNSQNDVQGEDFFLLSNVGLCTNYLGGKLTKEIDIKHKD